MHQVKEYIYQKRLPRHLQDKLISYYEYRYQGSFFKENIISDTLSSLLKPVLYLEEDIIYKAGTEGDCMYFIASGTVVLITFSGKEICHMHDGDYFGETVLVYPDRSRAESVIALEVCELLRLNRRDFKYLFPPKSEFYANLKQVAQEHLENISKLTEPSFHEGETM
ncbi:Potassium/sodium hyperpolarization-activated cyclic nucleotide-gated channel 2 [Harpegnathos saltator]|uniref:Potassium/sodium hyperpolarization-activated cyclic nucleotide-gated channel 2 n=1 Tax=Harpegnathos saltator TaxID=610380 RepID=E2BHH3_HARSA|nr:Potassium/sodium hyperpolarization-activated cyclic nucleotide-gated channel 2 [Harpegnathos saltator]